MGWTTTQLLEVSSDIKPPPATPVATKLAPGQQSTVSVQVTAPSTPGPFHAFYRLQGPAGRKFGQRLACALVVSTDAEVTHDVPVATAAAQVLPLPLPHSAGEGVHGEAGVGIHACRELQCQLSAWNEWDIRFTIDTGSSHEDDSGL